MPSLLSKKTTITKKKISLEAKIKYFDNSKYLNFVSSSGLEGIKITEVEQNLEQLIAKYHTAGSSADGR
jgi:hypothetical protein